MAAARSERDERIDGYHDELTRNLVRAYELRRSEPDLSIQLLRQAAEGLCYCVLLEKNRLGLEHREELAPLIDRTAPFLREDRETLQALREWGNRSSHAQGRPRSASVEEATALFLMSARPIRWLHREILEQPLPESLESRYRALVMPSPGPTSAAVNASKYMMFGAGILGVSLVAVLSYRVRGAGAGEASPTAVSAGTGPAPAEDAAVQVRKLEAALDERDEVKVARLYAEPTTLFGRRFATRAEVATWLRSWWSQHPDEKAAFSACREVGSTVRGNVFACEGTVTRRGKALKFTECIRWSPEGLIDLRDTASAPGSSSGGCSLE